METTKPVEDQGFSLWSSWVAKNKEVIPRGGVGKERKEEKRKIKNSPFLALMLLAEIIFYPSVHRVTTQLSLEPPPGAVVRSSDKDLCGLFSFPTPLKINRGGNVYGLVG